MRLTRKNAFQFLISGFLLAFALAPLGAQSTSAAPQDPALKPGDTRPLGTSDAKPSIETRAKPQPGEIKDTPDNRRAPISASIRLSYSFRCRSTIR